MKTISTRISSLERWGMRASMDFQPEAVAYVREAGYTGGVPGPDESANSAAAESNRFFDRRTKLEMAAKLHRTPEIFGQRSPQALSWRGNRPLCANRGQQPMSYCDVRRRIITLWGRIILS